MKIAMVYERNNLFYIRASSQTIAGVWIDDGDCHVISIDSDFEEIGKYVRFALNNSNSNIPHPLDWKAINAPLLKAAKVKSWITFGKTAKCIIVILEKDIKICPTKNYSYLNQGFIEFESSTIFVPVDIGNIELGKNIKKAWLSCE